MSPCATTVWLVSAFGGGFVYGVYPLFLRSGGLSQLKPIGIPATWSPRTVRSTHMPEKASSTRRLTKFYGERLSSLERVIQALAAQGLDTEHLRASDIYSRSLDCQNLGSYAMLEVLASVASEYGTLGPEDKVLDIGCGVGGPGRSWSTVSAAPCGPTRRGGTFRGFDRQPASFHEPLTLES